jgi:hypothetical protein
VLAVLGGLIGSPLGLLTSPGVLFLLNKNMKGKEGKQPNRFAVWALIGIIGAPVSMVLGRLGEFKEAQKTIQESKTAVNTETKGTEASAPEETKEPLPAPPALGQEFRGYTVYFGTGGGMLTSEDPAYWDAKTKTVTFFSKRLNAQVQCQNQVIKVKSGGNWVATDQPLSCEFDKISPPIHAGVPPQVFVNEFDYGKIAKGSQSSGGDLREKVALR